MLQLLDAASRFYDNEHHGCVLMACGPRYELTYFAEQTSNMQRFIRHILNNQGMSFLQQCLYSFFFSPPLEKMEATQFQRKLS